MKKVTLFLFLCLMSIGIQAQTTRYASPTGSTTVTGTDPAQPMELRLAINSTADGDTLLLEGTFTFADDTEIIFFQGRNNITVGSYGAGATIQRNTTAAASGISLIVIVDSTNMTVENINFTNNFGPNSRAIFMYGSGDNYTIQNNTFSNIGWSTDATANPIDATTGIASGANVIIALGNKNPTSSGIVNTNGEITNLNILNNTISNCITGTSESITVAGNVDGFLVENNTITDVTNIGIDAAGHFSFVQDFETGEFLNTNYPQLNQARNGVISGNTVTNAVSLVAVSAGIYCDGCRDVVIKENLVTGSGTGFSIGCEVGGGNTAENVYLVNNIARDNLQSGMFLGSITSEGGTALSSVNNSVVRNNVFYNNNAQGSTFFNTFSIALSKGDNNEISNNIIHLRENIEGTGINGVGITVFDGISPNITNYTITNNLFYKTSGATVSVAEQLNANGTALTITGSVLADPAFLDVNNNLFEIPTTSAAADAGTAITLVANETDFDGDARVQGTSVDIGAQESAASTCTASVITPHINHVTPVNYWFQKSEVTLIETHANVWFEVRSADNGTVTWTGPTGSDFSVINEVLYINTVATTDAGDYTATFTNDCGEQTTQVFTLNVNALCTPSVITPHINHVTPVNYWFQKSEVTLIETHANVWFEVRSADNGTVTWTGPTGGDFSVINEVLYINTVATTDAGDYTATFTNDCGDQTTQVFTLNVNSLSFPDPNKTYYIDAAHGTASKSRLASTGQSEDAYTTAIGTTGDDVEWKFVDKGNGYWHIQRAAGGSKPRLRTDNSINADMQPTSSSGAYTYYDFTNSSSVSGAYHLTLPNGPNNHKRLQITPSGVVRFTKDSFTGTWVSFYITETGNTASKDASNDKVVDGNQSIFSVYPNPASDTINLLGLEEGQSVQVYNIIGAKVIETTQSSINISNLKTGMYFIKSKEQTVKFIKK